MGERDDHEGGGSETIQDIIDPRDARDPMVSDGGPVGEIEGALAIAAAPDDEVSEENVTREQRRSRRKRAVRARTISVKRMTKRELELGRMLYPEVDVEKPKTRAECAEGHRPCPFVSCKHHLYLDVSARTGAIKLNFPDLEVWDMTETCALDVADRGGTTLEEVGAIMNLTRERIRQVEVKGLAKLEALKDMAALRDYVDEGPIGKRRLPVLTRDEDEDEEEHDVDEDDDDEPVASTRAIARPVVAPVAVVADVEVDVEDVVDDDDDEDEDEDDATHDVAPASEEFDVEAFASAED